MATSRGLDRAPAGLASAPAAIPAAVLLLALAAAGRTAVPSIPGAVGLLAAALAGPSQLRRWLAPAALGLALGWASAADSPPPDPGRPSVLVGRLEGRWRREPDGASAWLQAVHFRQGVEVRRWRERVLLVLPPAVEPPAGGSLRVRGYLRRAPPLANPESVALGAWTLWAKSALFVRVEGADRGLPAWSRALATRVDQALLARGDSPGIQLARALVVGESRALPESWLHGLRRTGLSHAISLSGLHVALVAAIGLRLGAALPAALRWSVAVVAVALYSLVGGGCPSLVRASAMAAVPVVAWAAGRQGGSLNALAVVAAALALLRPGWIADLGFQLTVLATAGLIWAGPRLAVAWPALPPWLSRSLGATLGAQLFTLPLVLGTFRLATPWASLWNLLAVPWLAVALAGSLAFAGAAVLLGDRASVLVPWLDLAAAPFGWPSRLPPRGAWPLSLAGGVAVGFAALALWLLLRPRRAAWGAALGLLVASLAPRDEARPELHLLDVGQGDSILLRDGRAAALVDGGGWRHGDIASRVTIPALAGLGVRRLDAIVLSHPDEDHCRGLAQLAGVVAIDELWLGPGWPGRECVRRLATQPGIRLRPWRAGELRSIGGWTLQALPSGARAASGNNDGSLAVMARAGGRQVLLTGDLEAAGEHRLLRAWPAAGLRADVLKVAHHGSRTSSSEALLAAVDPAIALISAGRDNRFGHSAAEVVERLQGRGIRILRTDRVGWVRLRFPANGALEIATPAAPPGSSP